MSLLDRLTGNRELIEAAAGPSEGAYIRGLEESLDNERGRADYVDEENGLLKESLADAQLALEDVGWRRMAGASQTEFTIDGIKRGAELCRIMAVVNPLINRALNLRIAYVWGQGVSITAKADGQEDGEQDVNAVVRAFMDDKGNQRVFFSAAAHERVERTVGTDGNFFAALYTDPLSGRVQVRSVPLPEIQEIITNPEDRADPWYYRRATYSTQLVVMAGQETFTTERQNITYHPAVSYQPAQRPPMINGHKVRWDAPVLHVAVNELDGWKFGIGDAYPALAWSRAYKEFLEDWARLVKALSRYAYKASPTSARAAQQVRQRVAAPASVDPVTGQQNTAGSTAILPPGSTLEAIPKTGATIDSESGKPLAAMVAAAMGLPVTWLLGDPGITGARATAETLDQPTQLTMQGRQGVWADFIRDLCDYVVDQAIKAPRGPLQGTRVTDPVTGLTSWALKGDDDGTMRTVEIAFPDLDDTALNFKVQAIAAADTTGKMPPLTILRLLADAFELENVDELIDAVTDDQGNFVDPRVNAGQAAVDAFRAGQDPAAQFGGPQADKPADEPNASE